jgi:hypothetical protein
MLLLFFLVFLLVVAGLIIGNGVLARLDPWQYFDRSGDRTIISIWIGVLILANYFLLISLFGPLSPRTAIFATLPLLGFSLLSPQNRKNLGVLISRARAGIFVGIMALTLGVAAYCSQVIVWYDSGLYHVQLIKWLSEFGLVPGLALIHSRFGIVSSWFTLPAVFNHGMLQGRIASLPGALCLLLLVGHAFIAFLHIAEQRGRIQDLYIFAASLLVVPIILFWGLPNSPSPDLPVIVLAPVVAWTLLAISNCKNNLNRSDCAIQGTLVPLILAVGAVSVKLSALPLVIVAGCFYLLNGKLSIKKALVVGGMIVLPLIPVVSAGIVASGCAFYPVSYLCTDLPWSLGAAAAETESMVIQGWARWGGAPPEHATPCGWILPWLYNEKIFSVLILLSLLATISLLLPRTRSVLRKNASVLMVGITGIGFALYSAPTWRFGLGYATVLLALTAAIQIQACAGLPERLNKTKGFKNFGFIGIAVAIVLGLHVHILPRPSYRLLDEAVAKGLITPADHPHVNLLLPPEIWNLSYAWDKKKNKVEAYQTEIIQLKAGDVIYYKPEGTDSCWDTPLPCSPYKLTNIRLYQPTKGLAGGFEKYSPDSQGLPLTHF